MKTWSTDPPNSYDTPNTGTTLAGFEVKLPTDTKKLDYRSSCSRECCKECKSTNTTLEKWSSKKKISERLKELNN